MTDLTPDQEAALLAALTDTCRAAGYVVEAIDRGLEVSGEDQDEGAFYLLPDHGWLQIRCLVLDHDDLDAARDLTALFERAPIRPIVSRITRAHWPSFYNVVTGKTLALPNLIALQHIPLSPAGVIAKRPAPIALPNSCAA